MAYSSTPCRQSRLRLTHHRTVVRCCLQEEKQLEDDRVARMQIVARNVAKKSSTGGANLDDDDDGNCADCCRCHPSMSSGEDTALWLFSGRRNRFYKKEEETLKNSDLTLYKVSHEKMLVLAPRQDAKLVTSVTSPRDTHTSSASKKKEEENAFAYVISEKRWDDRHLWVTYDVQTIEVSRGGVTEDLIASRLRKGSDFVQLQKLVASLKGLLNSEEELEEAFGDVRALMQFQPPNQGFGAIEDVDVDNLTPEEEHVKAVFERIDADHSKFLDKEEVKDLLECAPLNLISLHESNEAKERLADQILLTMDRDSNYKIDFPEFLQVGLAACWQHCFDNPSCVGLTVAHPFVSLQWWNTNGKYLKSEMKWNSMTRVSILHKLREWRGLIEAAEEQLDKMGAVLQVTIGRDGRPTAAEHSHRTPRLACNYIRHSVDRLQLHPMRHCL